MSRNKYKKKKYVDLPDAIRNLDTEWRSYRQLYSVSDGGRIFSHCRGRLIAEKPMKIGYRAIKDLTTGSILYVHRIVAELFISEIPAGHFVNHKDGNRSNNSVSNLEIVTRGENEIHARKYLGKVAGRKRLP